MNLKHFVRPDIVGMKPYTPIVPFEVLSERLGRDPADIVKLDANENPYGPSPKALEYIQSGKYFHIYPDPESNALLDKLSQYVGVDKKYLVAGMGADELIDLVLRVVLNPGDVVIDCPPSFGMYPFSTVVNAGKYVAVDRSADFQLNIPAIEAAIQHVPNAKVLFLCSPNNPNGDIISEDDLKRLLALPVLVILDQAYVDFSLFSGDKSYMDWVEKHENLVVLRTFSKLAGLAGLRVGYGAIPLWLKPHLMKIKQPYNVNVAAGLAALGSLDDQEWLHEKMESLVSERDRMVAELAQFKWLRPYPSHSNFVLFNVVGRDAGELKKELEKHGVLVRYFAKKGVDNCIRISAGRPDQTDRLIEALKIID